jgi:tetratricopeptide (TPR) repeat protein
VARTKPKLQKRTAEEQKPAMRPSVPAEWRRHVLPILGLWLIALASYSNSFRDGFVFDNDWVILQDARVHAITSENLQLIFTEDYSYLHSSSGLFRPLTTLSFLFNYAVLGNGSEPAGYHGINLVLQAVNMTLVYALGLILFSGAGVFPALALAAVWGLHPVLTESVTNMVGRADLLAGFGVLAGLLCYLRFAAGKRRGLWLAGFVSAVIIGLFSKESAVVLVALMPAYDLIFGVVRAPEFWRRRWQAYAAFGIVLLVFLALRANALGHSVRPPFPYTDNPIAEAGFWVGRLTAFQVIARYLGLLIWPLYLSADYSFNQNPLFSLHMSAAADWLGIIGLAACLGLAALALFCYRKQKAVCWAILFFLITLAPTANVFLAIGSIMAERFLYLPALGFVMALVWTITRIPPRPRWAVAAVLVLLAGARTYARNFDWLDDRSLWTSAASATPDSYKMQLHLATVLAGASGKTLDEALPAVDRCLALLAGLTDEQNVPQAYSMAGFFYRSKGDAVQSKGPESREWYQKALAALERGERIDRAQAEQIRQLNAAHGIQTAPLGWHPLYLELGDAYLRLGQRDKAIEAFTYGRTLNAVPEFFEEMSLVYRDSGNVEKSEVTLWEGLMSNPAASQLGSALASLYRRNDPSGCAVRVSGGTLSFNSGCPTVRSQACTAAENMKQFYGQIGQPDTAGTIQQRAQREFGCSR